MTSFAPRRLLLVFSTLALLAGTAPADVLAPNDPTIAGTLDIWLADAGNRFDGATWLDTSGNGNDAVAFGSNGRVTYAAGTASTQFSITGVAFSGSADDLMTAGGTYAMLTDVTIFTVYSTSDAESGTRPVGLGSTASKDAVASGVFNLAADGSLRYDNGNNAGTNNTVDTLLVRASRLDSGAIADWVGGAVNIANTSSASGGAIPNGLGADANALYLGDLRAGNTRVPSGGPTTSSDLFISQVIVYKSALTDQQVVDVSNWLTANPSGQLTKLTITNIELTGGDVVLTTNVPAASLTPQISQDLTVGSFVDVTGVMFSVTGTNEITIDSSALTPPSDFFRVRE